MNMQILNSEIQSNQTVPTNFDIDGASVLGVCDYTVPCNMVEHDLDATYQNIASDLQARYGIKVSVAKS